jgi:predicted dehydrogenase
MQQMWNNLRIGIIGQGSQYNRISKILKSKRIKFTIYKPSRNTNYYNKKKFDKLKKCNVIFILSPNGTHFEYIKFLKNDRYIFCEKPPVNTLHDLKKLKRIKSNKIYFNYNFRFSKISEILGKIKKFHLKELLYASITTGHGLGFKKDYSKSWRSNRKICKKGVFEIVSIHWVDLINYHFHIKKIQNLNLRNYIKNTNGIDNSYCKIYLKNKSEVDIFSSYTSPLIKRMIFVFENGIIEQNDNFIEIRGPAINLDKNNFFKKPKLIKKINLNDNKDYILSLEKSVIYFLNHAIKNKNFSKEHLKKSLTSNSFII